MDTKNQFTFFLLSVAIGVVGGLLYELFAVVRFLFRCNRGKRKMLGIGLDITYCLAFSVLCIVLMYCLHFPDFRAYMWIGWLTGGAIYLRILRKMVAFCEKVCYNVLVKMLAKAKSKEKTLQKRED